jgi:hypothetical protein
VGEAEKTPENQWHGLNPSRGLHASEYACSPKFVGRLHGSGKALKHVAVVGLIFLTESALLFPEDAPQSPSSNA